MFCPVKFRFVFCFAALFCLFLGVGCDNKGEPIINKGTINKHIRLANELKKKFNDSLPNPGLIQFIPYFKDFQKWVDEINSHQQVDSVVSAQFDFSTLLPVQNVKSSEYRYMIFADSLQNVEKIIQHHIHLKDVNYTYYVNRIFGGRYLLFAVFSSAASKSHSPGFFLFDKKENVKYGISFSPDNSYYLLNIRSLSLMESDDLETKSMIVYNLFSPRYLINVQNGLARDSIFYQKTGEPEINLFIHLQDLKRILSSADSLRSQKYFLVDSTRSSFTNSSGGFSIRDILEALKE